VPRYGRASRRGLRLEHLLGEAECHAVGLRAVHGDDEKHCYRDDHDLGLRGSCSMWALRSSYSAVVISPAA